MAKHSAPRLKYVPNTMTALTTIPTTTLSSCLNDSNRAGTRIPAVVSTRSFHSTQQRPILPVIGLVSAAVFIRYSVRALQRMEMEEEEYRQKLLDLGIEVDDADMADADVAERVNCSRRFIGIDLGTSGVKLSYNNALLDGDKPSVVEADDGSRSLPSYFYAGDEGSVVGKLAKKKLYDPPIGKMVFSPLNELLIGNVASDDSVNSGLSSLLSTAVGTVVNKKITTNKEHYRAVFTVPSAITRQQLERYEESAESAGCGDGAIFYPDAVCVVIGGRDLGLLDNGKKGGGLVVDVGHNLCQVTLLEGNVGDDSDNGLLESSCSSSFNGHILESSLASHLASKFQEENGIDLLIDPQAKQRLFDAAEEAITELTKKKRVEVNVPYITATSSGAKHLKSVVSGGLLKEIVKENVDLEGEIGRLLMETLTKGGKTPMDLDYILLCGGASRSPVIAEAVRGSVAMLGGEAFVEDTLKVVSDGKKGGVAVEDLPAYGAVIKAAAELSSD